MIIKYGDMYPMLRDKTSWNGYRIPTEKELYLAEAEMDERNWGPGCKRGGKKKKGEK